MKRRYIMHIHFVCRHQFADILHIDIPSVLPLFVNSLPVSGILSSADNLCNSLEPDQARQDVRPDLDPNCLTLIVFLKELFEKLFFKKISADDKRNDEKLPSMQRVKYQSSCHRSR